MLVSLLLLFFLGLYDKPVVIEGKRERKTPVFLASQTAPQTMTIPKSLTFEVIVMLSSQGHGGSWLGCQVLPAIGAASGLRLVTNYFIVEGCLRHPTSTQQHSCLLFVSISLLKKQ